MNKECIIHFKHVPCFKHYHTYVKHRDSGGGTGHKKSYLGSYVRLGFLVKNRLFTLKS